MLSDMLTYATVVVAVAIAVLNVIAPLTKTEWDNWALSLLRRLEELVLKALIPQARQMLAASSQAASSPAAETPKGPSEN